ncbi:MAG: glycosyltransferase [Acidobacteria bacterium]|nr:glycosyltransferase [Acidobacteriota bacterium]
MRDSTLFGQGKLRLLLVGPYPPPHGGISIHVASAQKQLRRAGVECRVLNMNRGAPASDQVIGCRNAWDFARALLAHARGGWVLHMHTNGHNWKSWLAALLCGVAGWRARACLLTLHSGMVPDYLRPGMFWRRGLARFACALYTRVIVVTPQIREAIASLRVRDGRLQVIPAFIPGAVAGGPVPAADPFVRRHQPLLTAVLFFRAEYGFELLVQAVARLRWRHPRIGCLVLGGGEGEVEARRQIRAAGLEDAFLLAGDVPHETCLALMSRSDLFVRPAWKDGDSVSLREALALGVTAVASNVGARPGKVLLFEPGDLQSLIVQIETGLQRRGCRRNRPAASPGPEGIARLQELYRSVASWGGMQ